MVDEPVKSNPLLSGIQSIPIPGDSGSSTSRLPLLRNVTKVILCFDPSKTSASCSPSGDADQLNTPGAWSSQSGCTFPSSGSNENSRSVVASTQSFEGFRKH